MTDRPPPNRTCADDLLPIVCTGAIRAGDVARRCSTTTADHRYRALRRELARMGVEVVVIEPGGVLTEMPGRVIAATEKLASTMTAEQHQRYGELIQSISAQTAAHTASGVPAETVSTVIVKAITVSKPRPRYTVGREATLLRFTKLLPDRALDRVLAAALRRHRPHARAEQSMAVILE